MQNDVNELEANAVIQKDAWDVMVQNIMKINDRLSLLATKVDYLEGQSKRNNLIIDVIAESPRETWAELEKKVKSLFVEKLQLHREGKGTLYWEPGRETPRHIVVRFHKYKDTGQIGSFGKSQKSKRHQNIHQ